MKQIIHTGTKVVTRYEVWCNLCDYVAECSTREDAARLGGRHYKCHRALGDVE